MSSTRLLIVDDEAHQRNILSDYLTSQGFSVLTAGGGQEALDLLSKGDSGVQGVISDLSMPGLDGLELLKRSKALDPEIGFIMVTAHGSIEVAIQAVKNGAHDFLPKPIEFEELLLRIKQMLTRRALEKKAETLEHENRRLRGGPAVIGESRAMKELMNELDRVTQTDATVLLIGQTGVGKEVLARRIHEASSRAKSAFVAVNCSAIPENLAESEFFGHEKGAFTGADRRVTGYFERADGGTLFLDELGEMDLKLQPKILRAIEERKITRVGGSADVPVNTRIIAATNRDLKSMVEEGKFREDLYYRLNVVQLRIPPLRDRSEDIPALAKHLATRHAKNMNVPLDDVDPSFCMALSNYDFPGNVRELSNLVERAVIYMKGRRLSAEHLPSDFRSGPSVAQVAISIPGATGTLAEQVAAFEKQIIESNLAANGHDVDRCATDLKISRSTLYTKISKYGIKLP